MSVNEHTGSIIVSDAVWPEDVAFLQALQSSWIHQYADYLGQETATRLVQRLLANGELYPDAKQPLLAAYAGEKMVGIACLRPMQGLSLISMLEVLGGYQRQGVGSALIAALAKRSDRLLTHVSIHRPWVSTFYQRLGFTELDRSVVDHYGHLLEFDLLVK